MLSYYQLRYKDNDGRKQKIHKFPYDWSLSDARTYASGFSEHPKRDQSEVWVEHVTENGRYPDIKVEVIYKDGKIV